MSQINNEVPWAKISTKPYLLNLFVSNVECLSWAKSSNK